MAEIKIGDRLIGDGHPTYIIAEIGVNHNGFLDLALKTGQLSLAGEETVNNKPAYRLKVTIEGGAPVEFYLDKESCLLVKLTAVVNEGGMTMTINSYPTDYREMSGIIVPMKTVSITQVMEFTMNFTKVEVDLPMDDQIFSVK